MDRSDRSDNKSKFPSCSVMRDYVNLNMGKSQKSQDALSASTQHLSAEDHFYYSEVFSMFDTDKSGAIDLQELQEAVASIGIESSEAELKIMVCPDKTHPRWPQ